MAEMNRDLSHNFVSKPVYLRHKHQYWCKRLMGMGLLTDQMFLGGIYDFEMYRFIHKSVKHFIKFATNGLRNGS
jgi:hypothetical protein